jgi:hypothetical protein
MVEVGGWGWGGNRAEARKWEQLWQGRERPAASTCCVTLSSLQGLSAALSCPEALG